MKNVQNQQQEKAYESKYANGMAEKIKDGPYMIESSSIRLEENEYRNQNKLKDVLQANKIFIEEQE
jgi:hypothetical protein